jgi:hypothetical protein
LPRPLIAKYHAKGVGSAQNLLSARGRGSQLFAVAIAGSLFNLGRFEVKYSYEQYSQFVTAKCLLNGGYSIEMG